MSKWRYIPLRVQKVDVKDVDTLLIKVVPSRIEDMYDYTVDSKGGVLNYMTNIEPFEQTLDWLNHAIDLSNDVLDEQRIRGVAFTVPLRHFSPSDVVKSLNAHVPLYEDNMSSATGIYFDAECKPED